MSDTETRLPFPEYMLGSMLVEPPYVETDQIPLIRNGRTMWMPASSFTAIGGTIVLQKLGADPSEGPWPGLVVLYVVQGDGDSATLRMQAGTDPTPIDIAVNVGSGF